jgi:hypothetical protein
MADSGEAAAILRRALDYPYEAPGRSYLYCDGEARELPADPDLSGRTPLLSYGANASPEALGRKLAPLSGEALPVLRAALEGFDVVYSAHVSPYGAIPATLRKSPGTTAPVFVLHPTPVQHAVRSSGRTLPELDQPAILDRVRAHLEPHLTLEEFVRTSVARGGIRPLRICAVPDGR